MKKMTPCMALVFVLCFTGSAQAMEELALALLIFSTRFAGNCSVDTRDHVPVNMPKIIPYTASTHTGLEGSLLTRCSVVFNPESKGNSTVTCPITLPVVVCESSRTKQQHKSNDVKD